MKPPPLTYSRPRSVDEATSTLQDHGSEAKILAGGQSLVPMLNMRLARPSHLVDISAITELRGIRRERNGSLWIGASTTHRELERPDDPTIAAEHPLLPEAARFIGHYPIRTRGTIGGSLAHADPSAEWCLVALVLDAEVEAQSPAGSRRIPAADLFAGFFTTTLTDTELITSVTLPPPAAGTAFAEVARRHGDFATVAVAAAIRIDGNRCTHARLAVGGVAPAPLRLHEVEEMLMDELWDGDLLVEAAAQAGREVDPSSDMHASAALRRRLTWTLTRDALNRAAEAATKEARNE